MAEFQIGNIATKTALCGKGQGGLVNDCVCDGMCCIARADNPVRTVSSCMWRRYTIALLLLLKSRGAWSKY